MSKNNSPIRILPHAILPFTPYLIAYYLIFAQNEWGTGFSILLIWLLVDISLTLFGQDLFIIWTKIPNEKLDQN